MGYAKVSQMLGDEPIGESVEVDPTQMLGEPAEGADDSVAGVCPTCGGGGALRVDRVKLELVPPEGEGSVDRVKLELVPVDGAAPEEMLAPDEELPGEELPEEMPAPDEELPV